MTRKLNLLQITHDLAIGGLQQVVVNLCQSVDRERFNVSVLCLRSLGPLADVIRQSGIPVILLPQKERGTDYFSFLKVARLLRTMQVDVIHSHNTQPLVDGTIGAMLAGVRTVVHTDHARSFPDKFRYMLAEWALSHYVYRMVGVSAHTSQNLIRYEHIAPRRIVTIANGIPGHRFRGPLDLRAKRESLGIAPDDLVIGLGARLTEQKGVDYLLQAMPAILAAHPHTTLVVAGEGPLEQALRERTRQLNIEGRVRFIGARTDMNEVIRLFDVYVMPSLWEGLPMVLLEAMAAGCAIVATDVGGNSTAVAHDANGLLVPPADPAALVGAVVRLLSDAPLRARFSAAGMALFDRQFDAARMTRQYEALYRREPDGTGR